MNILKLKYCDIKKISGISLLLLALNNYLLYIIAGIAVIYTLVLTKKEYLPGITVIIFLSVTSTISEDLRNVADILCLIILFILYFQKEGLSVSLLKTLPRPVKILSALLLTSLILSTLFNSSYTIGAGDIFRMALFLLIIFLFYSSLESMKSIKIIIYSLVLSAMIMSLSIIISFLQSDLALYILETKMVVKERGYMGNEAGTGGVLAITIQLTLYLIFNSSKNKKYLYIALLLQSAALFLTNSRGAIIAAFVGIIVLSFILKREQLKKTLIRIVIAAGLFYLYIPSVFSAFELYFRTDRILENTRYFLWDISFDVIRSHPIFGVGPGMFKYYMYKYLPVMLGSWNEQGIRWVHDVAGAGHSHSFYLYRWSEVGIFGLAVSLCFPLLLLKIAFKVAKQYKYNYEVYSLATIAFSIMIGMLFRGFVESTGIVTNGWISRDICIWLIFVFVSSIYYKKITVNESINIR